jgi:hypothetical protein
MPKSYESYETCAVETMLVSYHRSVGFISGHLQRANVRSVAPLPASGSDYPPDTARLILDVDPNVTLVEALAANRRQVFPLTFAA